MNWCVFNSEVKYLKFGMDLTWGVLKKRQIFNLHKSRIYPSNFDVYYTTELNIPIEF